MFYNHEESKGNKYVLCSFIHGHKIWKEGLTHTPYGFK
jgi:hypothetical protein